MSDIPVNALSIHDVISYLDTTGWQRQPTEWRGLGVWGLAHGAEYEVLVPLDSGFRDDAQRLRDIIHTLVKVEDRPALDIVRDIANPLVDKQEYRTRPPTPSGTIPLPMAVRALTGITDLLASAARTLKEGVTPSLAGRRPAEVTSFLNGVLLDTTSPGSYVMTARVPVRRPVLAETGRGVPPAPVNQSAVRSSCACTKQSPPRTRPPRVSSTRAPLSKPSMKPSSTA